MDAKRVLAVLKQFESAHDEKAYDWCPFCMEVSGHKADCVFVALTAELEHEAQAETNGDSPADRIGYWQKRAIYAEHEAQEPGENDWQSTVGMFAGDAEMQAISEETRSVREAHKVEGGWKPGTEPPSDYRDILIIYGGRAIVFGNYNARHSMYCFEGGCGEVEIAPIDTRWHDLPPLPEEKP